MVEERREFKMFCFRIYCLVFVTMKVGVYSGRGEARKKSKSKRSQFQLNRFVVTVLRTVKRLFSGAVSL